MTVTDIGNDGERMTADAGIWSYYAHLSIYRFALPYLAGKKTLDAGCGTGYGSAYLAENGVTNLIACDAGNDAINFCKKRYSKSGINFHVQDLCARLPYDDRSFDAIFSSNVMEHLPDIDHFIEECRRILRPDGVMVIAVPPIIDANSLRVNIENMFHVTHLTPLGWCSKIERYFQDVKCFGHKPAGVFSDKDINHAEVSLPSDKVSIRETDFDFPEMQPEEQNRTGMITAVYVASQSRQKSLPPQPQEQLPYGWFPWTIAANIIGSERKAHQAALQMALMRAEATTESLREQGQASVLRTELENATRDLQQAQAVNRALRSSTSWKLTQPVRAIGNILKRTS